MSTLTRHRCGPVDLVMSPGLPAGAVAEHCIQLLRGIAPERPLKTGSRKTIYRTTIGTTPCLVKVYRTRGIFGRLKTLLQPSRARREYLAAAALAERNLVTPAPLVLAEKKKRGIVTVSLIAFAFIDGAAEVYDLLAPGGLSDPVDRQALIVAFARQIAALFRSGMHQDDCAANNFLACRGEPGWQVMIIDCERIRVRSQLSRDERIRLLAKLNRAGVEISLADRLRFLRAYLAADPLAPSLAACAREIQRRTAALLAADVRRGRQTSLHTQKHYRRIGSAGWSGLLRADIDLQAVMEQLGSDRQEASWQPVAMPAAEAERTWAALNVLKTAGLRAPLPVGMLRHGQHGWLVWAVDDQACAARELARSDGHMGFLARALPQAVRRAQQVC